MRRSFFYDNGTIGGGDFRPLINQRSPSLPRQEKSANIAQLAAEGRQRAGFLWQSSNDAQRQLSILPDRLAMPQAGIPYATHLDYRPIQESGKKISPWPEITYPVNCSACKCFYDGICDTMKRGAAWGRDHPHIEKRPSNYS